MTHDFHLRFKPEPKNGFFLSLKQKVDHYLKTEKQKTTNQRIITAKVVLLFTGLGMAFAGIFLSESSLGILVSYVGIGIFSSLIFLNVIHDAVHNCLFKNRKINFLLGYFLDFSGGNSYIWRIRHVNLHHPYPNVPDYDADVKQSAIVRLNSKDKWLSAHKYQHLYMVGLYFLYTLYWITVRDFRDFFVNSFANGKKLDIPRTEYAKLFFFKALYVFNLLVLPTLVFGQPFGLILLGFLLLHLTQSSIAITALLSAHVPEDALFVDPDAEGKLPHTWAEHQIKTTIDFATDNGFVNFMYGGFNHHVAHHLFPNINHSFYPKITQLIIQTAKEHQITYTSLGMLEAMKSHFKLLKNQGMEP